MYSFDEIIDRHGCNQVKYDFVSRVAPGAGEDALPMWIADMDFAAYPPLVDALHQRVDRRTFGYSLHKTPAFFNAIHGWLDFRFNWQVKDEDVFYTPGIMTAIAFLINGLCQPGDGVVIQPPVYDSFAEIIAHNNRRVVNNPLLHNKNGTYEIDFIDLEAKLSQAENKIFILCSPHNPVGRVWSESELRNVAALCQKYNVFLVSDESHCDLVRSGIQHIPIQKICPRVDGVATCMSPSKTFGISGFQIAYILLQGENIRSIWEQESMKYHVFNPNAMAITALQAAYNDCREYYNQSLVYLDKNLEYIAAFLSKDMPQARYRIPDATYLAWIDLKGYGYSAEELMNRCIKLGGLVPDCGAAFGPGGEGFIRLNAACPKTILEDGMARLKIAMEI